MKPYKTITGDTAVKIHAHTVLFFEEYKHADKLAKELGYASLQDYLNQKITDIIFWRLPQDHEDNVTPKEEIAQ